MSREFISKKTKNAFREFLVGWILREIKSEFEEAGIEFDRNYTPTVSGQRRTLVEQHYHTLNLKNSKDARRLVIAYESILVKAEALVSLHADQTAAERTIAGIVQCLKQDGLRYRNGKITSCSPESRPIFDDVASSRTVSEVTRRSIFDELRISGAPWAGRLSEIEFLSRLYNLDDLPSSDRRFKTLREDIQQHCVNNLDWSDDWVFADQRFDLLMGPDEPFLRFLCKIVHPVVRPNPLEAQQLITMFNKHLMADHWELVSTGEVSGMLVFSARHQTGAGVFFPVSTEPADVLSDEYVQELATKCDTRLAAKDFEGAITVSRTVLEAILHELEQRLVGTRGDYKGDLPKQFKQVAKLLRMDHERQDLDDRFKDVIRGFVMIVNGLAPLRNKMSDGHARERKPAPHHARVVVNAAKTVAAFLVESYHVQLEGGLVSNQTTVTKAAGR